MNQKYIACTLCGKKALWSYMPGEEYYCDKCVPRGCSCNLELKEGINIDSKEAELAESYFEPLDKLGRRYPCVEFSELSEERHLNTEEIKDSWVIYHKHNFQEQDWDAWGDIRNFGNF